MLTLGIAISHPLLCNFFGNQTLAKNPNIQDELSFEIMISRSPHNSDLKGLRSLRNIETGLSETNLAINFAKIQDSETHKVFKQNYNLGKETFEKEMIY